MISGYERKLAEISNRDAFTVTITLKTPEGFL